MKKLILILALFLVGTAAFYLICLLPLWFSKPHPMIFVPTAFVTV